MHRKTLQMFQIMWRLSWNCDGHFRSSNAINPASAYRWVGRNVINLSGALLVCRPSAIVRPAYFWVKVCNRIDRRQH